MRSQSQLGWPEGENVERQGPCSAGAAKEEGGHCGTSQRGTMHVLHFGALKVREDHCHKPACQGTAAMRIYLIGNITMFEQ